MPLRIFSKLFSSSFSYITTSSASDSVEYKSFRFLPPILLIYILLKPVLLEAFSIDCLLKSKLGLSSVAFESERRLL